MAAIGSNPDISDTVKTSLFQFLKSALPGFKEEEIDDIVLSYVVTVLQDMADGDGSDDEAFDQEAFCEMLSAYLPQAAAIPTELMIQWIFHLAQTQRELQRQRANKFSLDLSMVIEETVNVANASSSSSSNNKSVKSGKGADQLATSADLPQDKKRIVRYSENSDTGSSDSGFEGEDGQAKLDQLLEMFPSACLMEVNHCLSFTKGDLEQAAQLLIHRHECGQNLQSAPADRKVAKTLFRLDVDDKVLKQRIVHQYGYIDKEEDHRYHRPTIKKAEDKKMIRYRDSKIVSTKGERFSQVSKEESEEMKRNNVIS